MSGGKMIEQSAKRELIKKKGRKDIKADGGGTFFVNSVSSVR